MENIRRGTFETPCYSCSRVSAIAHRYVRTDTSRDDADVDGDVPQDVLLNPENGGGIEARRGDGRPLSRKCTYMYVCTFVASLYPCGATRTRAIRGAGRVASTPRDGRSGPRSSDRFETTLYPPIPSRSPRLPMLSPRSNGRATQYSARDRRTSR